MTLQRIPNNRIKELSDDEVIKRINEFVAGILSTTSDRIIHSKKRSVCEYRMYIFYGLNQKIGIKSSKIALYFGVTRREVNRKIKVLNKEYLTIKNGNNLYKDRLNLIQGFYYTEVKN